MSEQANLATILNSFEVSRLTRPELILVYGILCHALTLNPRSLPLSANDTKVIHDLADSVAFWLEQTDAYLDEQQS